MLALITLLALGLRLYHLDAQSLWYDEAFSAYLAAMSPAEIAARTAADIQPPLYYYLLHGWIGWMGDDEIGLRSLSLLFGLLTVPLIYAVTVELFRSSLAGLLAALLLAVSPLHIWYGQEARMYTLLTFLGLLSGYLLLLLTGRELSRGKQAALWLAYALTGIAAIYTHYFAFFLLAFQGVYLLLAWWGRGFRPRSLLLGGAAAGLTILLAYLPWLPYVLNRYRQDVSYWPGRLKLGEILVDIALFFTGGESVSEQAGVPLALGYVLIFLLCLAALVQFTIHNSQFTRHNSQSPNLPIYQPTIFPILYLLLPPTLILALSYFTPKFNARYVMIAHPALLLILAGGMAALWQRRPGSLGNVLRGALSSLMLLFLLGVSAYATRNAYTDPAFARADFRGAVRYLRKHIGPNKTVILVSGHMFPAFDYYAPDLERHLLPESQTLDTTQTLDYSIAGKLNEWLAGKDGVWLVLWQDEVVDPAGFLTAMLDDLAVEKPVDRTFAQVRLKHYRLPEGAVFTARPEIAHPADINFGNELRLLGYTQTGERQVTMFWEAIQPLAEDYRVSIVLRDPLGQSWGQWDGRPTAYYYPTDRWKPGRVVFGRYDLDLMPGSPPGDYGLDVGVYTEADPVGLDVLDKAGAPQGKRALLGGVRLAVAAATPEELGLSLEEGHDLGGGLSLLDWELGRREAQPGDRLPLTLIWGVTARPQGDYTLRLLVTDAGGQTWSAGDFPPTNIWHPTGGWLPGQAWRGQITFRLPIHVQPGTARLAAQLIAADGAPLGPPVELTDLEALSTERVFVPPQPQAPRRANFDNRVLLLGADLEPDPAAPGGVLRLTLYWQALTEMDTPYTVFVHLLDAQERVVVGHDGEPVDGTRPTTGWVPGEYIADGHSLTLPADLPPGDYVIEVGLYDAGVPAMPRLPVLDEEGHPAADRVIFGVQVR